MVSLSDVTILIYFDQSCDGDILQSVMIQLKWINHRALL